jgi:hypothetical protein
MELSRLPDRVIIYESAPVCIVVLVDRHPEDFYTMGKSQDIYYIELEHGWSVKPQEALGNIPHLP